MSLLSSIGKILGARWFLSLVGAIILALLVWFFGPLVAIAGHAVLESQVARLVAILVISLVWGISNLWVRRRAARANRALIDDIERTAEVDSEDAERKAIAAKFQQAVRQLRRRTFKGHRNFRDVPWYVFIGPPGSGKTTALKQSGLDFPVGDDERGLDGEDLRGVGGTRNCDWFFTDEAVIIDTAGRFTTLGSDRDSDHAAWLSFLDLLRKHRGRRALNGVLVAVPVDILMAADDALLLQHARAARSRLVEIADRLEVQLPVYLVISKVDRFAGFAPFFDDLTTEAREQVWGATLPLGEVPSGQEADQVGAEIGALVARLEDRRLARLEDVADLETRGAIVRFPEQVQALEPPLRRFVATALQATAYETPVIFRGFYLTSGIQEGAPVDHLMRAIASGFGIQTPELQGVSGQRSYFITRFLRDVVFAEAGLAALDPRAVRRHRWTERAAWAAAAAVFVLGVGGWTWSFLKASSEVHAQARALVAAGAQLEGVARADLGPQDHRLTPALITLDALRGLPAGDPDAVLRMGLDPSAPLAAIRDTAIRQGLLEVLYPREVVRLERFMAAHIHEADRVFLALKAYLMLTGEHPVDAEYLAAWLQEGAPIDEPQLQDPDARARLSDDQARLARELADGADMIAPDRALVERARATLREVPLAQRAYDALLARVASLDLPGWVPAERAGKNAERMLRRRSGLRLTEPVPGVFTHAGFHGVVLDVLPAVAETVSLESWVIDGSSAGELRRDTEIVGLESDVLDHYYDDYIRTWEVVLADVTLRSVTSLDDAVDMMKDLTGPSSTLEEFLRAVAAETALDRPLVPEDEGVDPAAAATAAAPAARRVLGARAGRAQRAVSSLLAADGDDAGSVPGAPVAEHFRDLRSAVEGTETAPPAMDAAVEALERLATELNRVTTSPDAEQALLERGGFAALTGDVAQRAASLPPPISSWLVGLAEETGSEGAGVVARQINALWRADVLPVCERALAGRFPFELTSPIDVSTDDFRRVLGPDGLVDGFVQEHLAELINRARRPWTWRTDVELSASALAQLERAAHIRDSLFRGGHGPAASFTLKALDMDPGASSMTLDLDGQEVTYRHAATPAVPLTWPGPNGANTTRLSFFVSGEAPRTFVTEGAWSWFRVLSAGGLRQAGQADAFRVTLGGGGHSAVLELRAASVDNPFDLGQLAAFRCPAAF